jgi:hypothetical protein
MSPSTIVASTLASLLFVLALFHVSWAFGRRFGASMVIPQVEGRPTISPGRGATLGVAVLLFGATLVALAQGHLLVGLPSVPVHWAALAAGTVFLLRALGEFRLVGFFKRVRDSNFARWDTWCFSPLSALMGGAFWYLAFH